MGWTVLSFCENIWKGLFGLSQILFELNIFQKTKWVATYCVLFKIFNKDSMASSVLSFDQSFLIQYDYIDWTVFYF